MILADKIMQLRKKNGWSQEELAERLGVSRQAVSKWEGMQATPDLNKLLAMSQLFGVSTDYLLKDEMETEEYVQDGDASAPRRMVTLQEANAFIALRQRASLIIAGGVLLCIVGVIALVVLGAWGNQHGQDLYGGLGLGALLLCVAAAVGMFLYCGHKNSPYEFLQKEDFDTEYGVAGMAEKKRGEDQKSCLLLLGVGIGLCVLCPIPVVCGAFLSWTDFHLALLLGLTLLMAGLGAALCIVAGVRRASVDQLLKQGEYSAQGKRRSRLTGPVSTAFWLLVTAIYLLWLFTDSSAASTSWIVWPIAGVLYAAVIVLCNAFADKKEG